MPTQGKRLKKIRIKLDLSQDEMASEINVSRQYLSNLENDRDILNNEKFVKLFQSYEINPTYIILGQGEMFLAKKFQDQLEIEAGLLERETFGRKLCYLQSFGNVTNTMLSSETKISQRRIESLAEDKEKVTLAEIMVLKDFFENRYSVKISLDSLVYGAQSAQIETRLSTLDTELIRQLAKKAGLI